MKDKNSAKDSNSYDVLWTLVDTPGRPLSILKLYKMAQVENVEVQNLEYQKLEELFEDRDSEVFDTILLNGWIDTFKKKLKLLKDQGTDIHNVYQNYFHFFTIDQTLDPPEFVDWCANNYSLSEKFIMDITNSKILCPVNYLVIRKTLLVPDEFTL